MNQLSISFDFEPRSAPYQRHSATKVSQLTQKELKTLLHYEMETGVFTWILSQSPRIKVGEVAGSVAGKRYRNISIKNVCHSAHRLAWLYATGAFQEGQIDHIDGNKLNNRLSNLRDVTPTENMENRNRAQVNGSTGFLGVRETKSTKTFRAVIQVARKKISLGTFKTAEQAYQAYVEGKRVLHVGGML